MKLQDFKAYNFIKNRLQHKYFLVKSAAILGTPFFTEHLRWLLLKSKFSGDPLTKSIWLITYRKKNKMLENMKN